MAKSRQTSGKKDREKKRLQKKKEKEQRKEERKSNNMKGASLDDMISYVDEYGNLTDTPPDPKAKKTKVDLSTIQLGAAKREEEDPIKTGKVDFFNTDKGFGFIIDSFGKERYFFHVNGLIDQVAENDKVQFELERGPKGWNAINVKKQ